METFQYWMVGWLRGEGGGGGGGGGGGAEIAVILKGQVGKIACCGLHW